LLEPQRTNIVPYSEQFDNAAWVKQNITVSPNTQTAPDGTLSADKIIVDNGEAFSSTSNYCRTAALTLTTGVVHTVSVYAKADGFDRMSVRMSTATTMGAGPTISVSVDLITGLQTGGTIGTYIGRTPAANGYYRYIFQTSAIASATNYLSFVPSDTTATEGNGVDGISIWGCGLEQASYATSYIPTLSTSVTRVADAASKTGISSLIGQTEGTLVVDFIYTNADDLSVQAFSLSDGTSSNRLIIGTIFNTKLVGRVDTGSVSQFDSLTAFDLVVGQQYKAAVAYKANDFAFYVNGVQISTDNSGTVGAMSAIQNNSGAGSGQAFYNVNQALLFKTRLTNDQLAELTA
jgi:hypothetical protein